MRIYVAGHRGMVGSAIVEKLDSRGVETVTRTRAQLDLLDASAVRRFMQAEKPDAVILAAAKVGGIHANNAYPAQFIFENLMIECNVIHNAFEAGVRKLLFLGSSCIYPRDAAQPLVEEVLLTGPLEPTNEPYAIAKIAGIKLCESYNRQYGTDYRSVMPTNLYGPRDDFQSENSHVLPALMARFHQAAREGAEEVVIWGSGTPRREFLHVNDIADACLFVLDLPEFDVPARQSADAELRQCRYRGRCFDRRACRNYGEGDRVLRTDHLRSLATRRDAAKAPGRVAAGGAGLAIEHRIGRRDRADLQLVSRSRRGPALAGHPQLTKRAPRAHIRSRAGTGPDRRIPLQRRGW